MVDVSLRHGVSRFHVLTYQGQRLAYLQVTKQTSPQPVTQDITPVLDPAPRALVTGLTKGEMEFSVFELWNESRWVALFTEHTGLWPPDALQAALDQGKLGLQKLERYSGHSYEVEYDLTGVRLVASSVAETFTVAGVRVPKHWRVTPAPRPAMHTISSPSPVPYSPPAVPVAPAESSTEGIEIEVGRYALRTFDLTHNRLGSLFQGGEWQDGVAIARCRGPQTPCAESPTKNCKCGLYGTLTLDQLAAEYPKRASRLVVVFAAEGKTMLGTKGLRTAAARVVAYWCASALEKEVLAANAPEARHFEDIHQMLADYKFPAYTPSRWWGAVDFPRYDPVPKPLFSPRPDRLSYPSALPGRQRTGHVSAPSTTGNSWGNILPLMGAATPGGKQAVQELLKSGPVKNRCGNCNLEHDGPPGRCVSCAPPLRCGKCHQLLNHGGCGC